MTWPQKLFPVVLMTVTAIAAVVVVPKFRNMRSEYGTAEAIHDLKQFVAQHEGRWPASPGELGNKYPVGGKVFIDYGMTSSRVIENQALLRNAVRPISGKFYTYAHYDENLNDLHSVILASNERERAAGKTENK